MRVYQFRHSGAGAHYIHTQRAQMLKSEFNYDLPESLIAQHPARVRSASRLLHVHPQGLSNSKIAGLPELLRPGDLLVFNDTRVIPARLHGHKSSGGRVQILVERLLDDRELLAQLGVSKTPKAGGEISVGDGRFTVLGREDDLFHLRFEGPGSLAEFLETAGELPLPPYIRHKPGAEDLERYQTTFAREPGAVAAPTAGLHFDEALLTALKARGIEMAYLTLHVGAGTFQPVRVDDLSQHRMHRERYVISQALCEAVEACRRRGGRLVAVGTTVTRAMESAMAAQPSLRPGASETELFITPGFQFRAVDLMLTNFHLPQSTLLMLVCAFGGKERILEAYRHAVRQRYRFFSYGDAMLVEPTVWSNNA